MSRLVFISYKFDDREIVGTVKSFFQPQGGACQGRPVFVENNVSANGERAIDAEIRRVMSPCACALFVVGENSHNSPWIGREAELAKSLGLGLVAVHLPKTTAGIPNELRACNPPIVKWDGGALCAALNLAAKKGA